MSVVDVASVEFDDATQFLQQRVSDGFDAQDLNHLNQVVGRRSREIHIRMRHDFEEVDAFGVQHPLGLSFETTGILVDDVHLRLANENLLNVRNTSQREVAEHVGFNALQEDLVTRRIVVVLDAFRLLQTNSQHELLRVIVVEDAAQISAKLFVDSFGDVSHQKLLVDHHLAVKLDAKQPRRHSARIDVFVRHLKVCANEFAILFDDGVRGIRVVVNLRDGGDAV